MIQPIIKRIPGLTREYGKPLAIAIDREAICKAIYAGFAYPAAVPLFSKDMDTYKYPYDPAAAKQLLKDAGYPNGFTFKVISYVLPASQEAPRIMEALASYWQQIGLDPKITVIDYNTYYSKSSVPWQDSRRVIAGSKRGNRGYAG